MHRIFVLITSVFATSCLALFGEETLTKEVQELVAKVVGNAEPLEKIDAFQKLGAMKPEFSKLGFRAILKGSNDEYSAMAGMELIRSGDDIGEVLAKKGGKWSYSNWTMLTSPAVTRLSSDFNAAAAIAGRQVLKQLIDKKDTPPVDEADISAVNLAAMAVTKAHVDSDYELLQKALAVFPAGTGLWAAVSVFDRAKSPEIEALAERTFRDANLPMALRVAAAVAVHKKNDDARKLILDEIPKVLAKYQNKSYVELTADNSIGDEFSCSIFISFLALAPAEEAKTIVFSNLNMPNRELSLHLGLLAASRWPKAVLSADLSIFTPEDRITLLAFLVHKHEETKEQVQQLVGKEVLAKKLIDIRKTGIPQPVRMLSVLLFAM